MPTARIAHGSGVSTVAYDDGFVSFDGERQSVAETGDIELLPPCEPRSVYCLGRNYPEYIEENADTIQENLTHDAELPEEVHFFLKNSTGVIASGDPIPYPSFSDKVGYGGELAAIIGESCKHLDPDAVPDVVRGYTIMNDVDAKDQEGITKIKVFDGSAPLGPATADVDPTSLQMRTTINGEIRQEATTANMYYEPPEAIAAISERVTLHPGDVIAMGSPANPGMIEPGDTIEIWYEGIGTLRNSVAPPDAGESAADR